jgi:hypothetical protein
MIRDQLETFGHGVYQTTLNLIIPNVKDIKFGITSDDVREQDLMPLENVEFIQRALRVIQTFIADDYLYPYASSVDFLHNTIWNGISKTADEWHSDAKESPDLFFLLYFNDMSVDNTGAFLIKDNLNNTSRIVPKEGTLIAVENNSSKWLHKAEQTQNQRIVACFRYKVSWN